MELGKKAKGEEKKERKMSKHVASKLAFRQKERIIDPKVIN